MPKHSRKRQKTEVDAGGKDHEELRLESLLFGTKYTPPKRITQDPTRELHNLTDADLFVIDDGAADSPIDLSNPEAESDEGELEIPTTKSGRTPAWVDPSDPPTVSLASNRLRKLRDQPSETALSGRQYESRLRRQYERINPQPEWAKAAKAQLPNNDISGVGELLSSTAGIIADRLSKVVLPSGQLSIERLRDVNQASTVSGNGQVKCLAFHPSPEVPVLCVGTDDRRIRLFNVDGHTSPLLQTLHIPTLPLSQSSVTFHPSGNSLLLTGQRPFYFVYDLQRGEMQHKAGRSLWGSYDSSTVLSASRKRSRGQNLMEGGASAEGMQTTCFSPQGDILAVAGRGGNIHLVDWKSGAGQVVGDLKCGASIKSLWWGNDDENLVALTNDSEVYVWNVRQRQCLNKWKDDGGFRGSVGDMAASAKGWLAIGSNTGLVNIYSSDSFSQASTNPKPIKSLGHLTTTISTLRFNHDAQILVVASREKKDAARVVHLPSLTAFSNWPTSSTPLGHVTTVEFSPKSEYMVIGNTRGKVLLYHLLQYGAARSIT